MPGPFPGMDPYLEAVEEWQGVHNRLMTALGDHLAGVVDPAFVVGIEERVYITHPIDDPGYPELGPDVALKRESRPLPANPSLILPQSPILAIAPSTLVETDLDLDIHDPYLVLRDAKSREVVTTLEVLSPANKVRGSRGWKALRAKQRLLRRGMAHLVEIDLLRRGLRLPGVSGQSDYCVTVLRSDQSRLRAWFFDLRDTMPVVGVPLPSPYPDVALPLQAVFNEMYDRAHYQRSLDYMRSVPPPPLRPADAAWVERTLQAWRDSRPA